MQPGSVLIMKGPEDEVRDQPLSRVIHPPLPPPPSTKPRNDGNARKTSPSTGNKGTAGQEGEFPCKKCGRSVIRNIPSVTAVVMETALFTYAKLDSSGYISGLRPNQPDIKHNIAEGNIAPALAHLEHVLVNRGKCLVVFERIKASCHALIK